LSKNLKILSLFLSVVLFVGVFDIFYIIKMRQNLEIKKKTVKLLTMPDLAVCSGAYYIRHRSLASVGDAFSVSPSLLAYFPSDFVYSPGNKR